MVEIRAVKHNTVLAVEVSDSTGDLTALFYGRSRIPGLMCGGKVRLRGQVGIKNGEPVMINPAYELLVPYTGKPAKDGKKPKGRAKTGRRRARGQGAYTAGNSSSYAGLIMTGCPSLMPTEPRNRTRAPHTMPGMCERP